MPRKHKQKYKNKKTLKNKIYKYKKNKSTIKNKKYHKKSQKRIKILDKVQNFMKEKQETVPTLDVAVKLIKNAKKNLKKNPIEASIKLTMATAILASYTPVKQTFDIGTLGEIRSGVHAPANPTTLIKYKDKRLNPNKTTFSQRELKTIRHNHPELYKSMIHYLL